MPTDVPSKPGANHEVTTTSRAEEMSPGLVYLPQRRTTGIISASLAITLPDNAVVDAYDVVVTARRAGAAPVDTVAQVRGSGQETSSSVVIDFGTPRTVSGLELTGSDTIESVRPWIGMLFDATPIDLTTPFKGTLVRAEVDRSGRMREESQPGKRAIEEAFRSILFAAEIRTERLLVTMQGEVDVADLVPRLSVILPQPPSDLELRIDGGAPVWSHPGPAQAGTTTGLSSDAWNAESELVVALGPALAALTGDPTSPASTTFQLELSSRIPGVLELRAHDVRLRHITRVRFDGPGATASDSAATTIATDSEGQSERALTLPEPPSGTSRVIDEVRAVITGELGDHRVLPPVGPDPAPLSASPDSGPLAEMILDSHRAACVKLDHDARLAELTAVRLPLQPSADGAEVRVVLWASDPAGQPDAPMEKGTSAAVLIESSRQERWTTFAFDAPIELDPTAPPWAAVLVTRGAVTWSLAALPGSGDPAASANSIRRGPPSGPWKALPAPFQSASSPLGQLRGRVRMAGLAPSDTPLAPVVLELWPGAASGTSSPPVADVTPTVQGAAATLAAPPGVSDAILRVVMRVAGEIAVRDVDVIWRATDPDTSGESPPGTT